MAIHDQVLVAARRICRARGAWSFRPAEIVDALPSINAGSVRTHVMSRCCVNAPAHHVHRWRYFRRLSRGVYEILPAHRSSNGNADPKRTSSTRAAPASSGVTVEVRESGGIYLAACPDLAAPIRGASLDIVAARVHQAIRQHGETGSAAPRVRLVVEIEPAAADPVLAVYERDIDRTLVRQALRMTHEQRLRALQGLIDGAEQIRGAAKRPRPHGRG